MPLMVAAAGKLPAPPLLLRREPVEATTDRLAQAVVDQLFVAGAAP